MSINIVQAITDQLGGGTLNKLSSLLGESPARTESAAKAAVPTLLAGFTHTASTPEGAQRLYNAASQQDPEVTTNFASKLNPSTATAGASGLSNLLGGAHFNNLTTALGQFTGIKAGGIGSLLGMIAPLALGFLGKHQRAEGLDASGLAGFLNGQRQNISSAMPTGLSTILGRIPGFSGFAPRTTVEEPSLATGAAPPYTGASYGSGRSEPGPAAARSAGRWLVPLLIALAVLWALWSWSHRRQAVPPAGQPANTAVEQQPATTPAANVGQITSGLRDTLNSTTTTLNGITDASSAEQAVPQLTQLNDKISSLKSQFNTLPASSKATATGTLQPMVSQIQQSSAKVRNLPGVGERVQGVLNQLDSNVTGLAANP